MISSKSHLLAYGTSPSVKTIPKWKETIKKFYLEILMWRLVSFWNIPAGKTDPEDFFFDTVRLKIFKASKHKSWVQIVNQASYFSPKQSIRKPIEIQKDK